MEPTLETKNQIPEDGATGIGAFVWELVKILVVAIIIIVPTRLFIAEPFIVSGSSMVPTFHDREYLIINKLGYYLGDPNRGDVVVLKYPKNSKEYFIKRIIGLPGDTVKIDKGVVLIVNSDFPEGRTLDEPYLSKNLLTSGGFEPITLKAGEYFVLGDNRSASSDSRVWGVLPGDKIVGKAFLRVLPISRFDLFNFESPLK